MKLTTGLLKRIIEEELERLAEELDSVEDVDAKETDADGYAKTLADEEDHQPSEPKSGKMFEAKRLAAKKLKLRESALEKELAKVRQAKARILKSLV